MRKRSQYIKTSFVFLTTVVDGQVAGIALISVEADSFSINNDLRFLQDRVYRLQHRGTNLGTCSTTDYDVLSKRKEIVTIESQTNELTTAPHRDPVAVRCSHGLWAPSSRRRRPYERKKPGKAPERHRVAKTMANDEIFEDVV